MQRSAVELGIIEGYYGKPWTWAERADTIAFLAPHGYRF
jgi:hyaluronoglucosaminidase